MIRLMTFNLRYPAPADGANYFPYRLPGIRQLLTAQTPDVIGFQEMTEDAYDAISAILPGYAFAGTGRNADLTGESCRVAYRKDRLTLCATDTFWLSPSPRLPGSRYADQSDCPRVCTWARLYCRETGLFFFFVNTHLDHVSEKARYDGLSLVLKTAARLKREQDLPLFVTGDFNCQPDETTYRLIGEHRLTDLTTPIGSTFHNYGRCEEKIDYILTDQPAGRFKVFSWRQSDAGAYLSDHDAVAADWETD